MKSAFSLGREAFFGCINLKNVNLSETLDVIEPYSFSQSGLETITIPSKAALTSKDAEWSGHQFSNCLNLKTVIFEDRAIYKKWSTIVHWNCRTTKNFKRFRSQDLYSNTSKE